MAVLSPVAKQQFFDNNGNPASGYKLYTYAANTTTPQATYSNAAGTVENPNPIILNSRGEAVIFLDPSLTYDYVLKTSTDVPVWTQEDVSSPSSGIFLQAGSGAVSRTAIAKLRGVAVTPEDFGAVGDGVTDDTLAFQKAVDSGATVVRGEVGKSYFIDGQRVQWHEQDLHRIGLVPYGTAIYSNGYWCGVIVPEGVMIEDAEIVITKGADTTKAHHAFGFGDSTSATRHNGGGLRNVTCRTLDFGGGSNRPRLFVAQSVDRFTADITLLGYDADNLLIGGYLFDCNRARLKVEGEFVEIAFVTEFCSGVKLDGSNLPNSNHLIDADKACSNFTVTNNVGVKDEQGEDADAFMEFNGVDGLVCTGNYLRGHGRGIQYSVKAHVADSWANALAGTAVATYYPCKNVLSDNDIIDSYFNAVLVGGDWANAPHNGEAGNTNITLRDRVSNASIWGGSATADAAAITVKECDGLDVDVEIDGSGGHGLHLNSYLESDYTGAGTWSVLNAKVRGRIRNCAYRGLRAVAPNEILYDGLYITNCGDSGATMMETRDLHEKAAKLHGSVIIDRGDSAATIGWNLSAGTSGTWAAGDFTVRMTPVVIGAFDNTDGIRLSGQGTSTPSMEPITFLPGSRIDKPDNPYFTENGARAYAGKPVGVLTPRFRGEQVYDSLEQAWYTAKNTSANTDWVRSSQPYTLLTGEQASVDPPSIATGAVYEHDLTVTGAALTDPVIGVSFSNDTQGVELTGTVTATDTVTVVFANNTGGNINLGSGTLRAWVWDRS